MTILTKKLEQEQPIEDIMADIMGELEQEQPIEDIMADIMGELPQEPKPSPTSPIMEQYGFPIMQQNLQRRSKVDELVNSALQASQQPTTPPQMPEKDVRKTFLNTVASQYPELYDEVFRHKDDLDPDAALNLAAHKRISEIEKSDPEKAKKELEKYRKILKQPTSTEPAISDQLPETAPESYQDFVKHLNFDPDQEAALQYAKYKKEQRLKEYEQKSALGKLYEIGIKQPAHSFYGAFSQAGADIFKVLDKWTDWVGEITGIHNKGELFKIIAKDQEKWANLVKEHGIHPEDYSNKTVAKIMKYLYEGMGKAAMDIPIMMGTGLPVYSALTGGAETIEQGKGAVKGFVEGLAQGTLLHYIFKGLGYLPTTGKIAAGGGIFGGQTLQEELHKNPKDRDYAKVVAEFLIGAGMTMGGKGKSYKELVDDIKTTYGKNYQPITDKLQELIEIAETTKDPAVLKQKESELAKAWDEFVKNPFTSQEIDITGKSQRIKQEGFPLPKQEAKDASILRKEEGGVSKEGVQPAISKETRSDAEQLAAQQAPQQVPSRSSGVRQEEQGLRKETEKEVEPVNIEGLRKSNPELFRTAEESNTVEEFINKVSKDKPETVDIEILTDFYNNVKRVQKRVYDEEISLKEPSEALGTKIDEKPTTITPEKKETMVELSRFEYNPNETDPVYTEHVTRLTNIINRAPNATKTVLIKTWDELPEGIKKNQVILYGDERARKGTRGTYHKPTDTVYIISGNNTTTDDLMITWFHEQVGHLGIKKMYGDKLDALLDDVIEIIDIAKFNKTEKNLKRPEGYSELDFNRRIAYEYLAKVAEKVAKKYRLTDVEQTTWQKFITWLKDTLNIQSTDKIEKIVLDSYRYVFDIKKTKTEVSDELQSRGFSEQQIGKMTKSTMLKIYDEKLTPDQVSIKQDGSLKVIEKPTEKPEIAKQKPTIEAEKGEVEPPKVVAPTEVEKPENLVKPEKKQLKKKTTPKVKEPSQMSRNELVAELEAAGITTVGITGKKVKNATKSNLIPLVEQLRSEKAKEPAPKVETPTEAVAEIVEGKRESTIGTKEFKKRMLVELDNAVKNAKSFSQDDLETLQYLRQNVRKKNDKELAEHKANLNKIYDKYGYITIEIPGDGKFKIVNTVQEIERVRKKVSGLSLETTPQKKTLAIPADKAASKKEKFAELIPLKQEGWFTDSHLAIKGEPPKNAIYKEGSNAANLKPILAQPSTPAKKLYYVIETEGKESVSRTPLPIVKDNKTEIVPEVIFEHEGKYWKYNQFYINSIEKRYPNVTYEIGKNGQLNAFDKGEKVAVLMPVRAERDTIYTTQPPLETQAREAGLLPTENQSVKPAEAEHPVVTKPEVEVKGGIKITKEEKGEVNPQTIDWIDKDQKTRTSKVIEIKENGDVVAEDRGKRITVKKEKIKKPTPTPTTTATMGGYQIERPSIMEMPEIVEMSKELLQGNYPLIKKKLRAGKGMALGLSRGTAIELKADIFKDPEVAKRVLAHEIGHVIDYLPEGTMLRGNILGRIATLKKYMSGVYQQLFKNAEIRDELKKLTQLWSPFDESNKKFARYRYSSKELYADAISVLMNDPELLKNIAPNFYKGFFKYMDRKPQVKKIYDDIQARIKSGDEAVFEQRQKNIREMFKHEKEIQRIEPQKQGLFSALKTAFVDKESEAFKPIKQTIKAGQTVNPSKNPQYWIEELPYVSSEVYQMLRDIENSLIKRIKEAGFTLEDIGEVLFEQRTIGERTEIANPMGMTPKDALEQMGYFEKQIGKERFEILLKFVEEFRDIRNNYVISLLKEAGMYSPELMTKIVENKYYATYDVLKYLNDQFGNANTAKIYRQIGTLNEIRNPFMATIMKDAALIRAANKNMTIEQYVEFMQQFHPNEITPAKTKAVKRISGEVYQEAIEPTNPNLGLIMYMKDGKMKGFYVNKEIAKTFNRDPYEAGMIYRTWQNVLQPFKELFVGKNIPWSLWNIQRDLRAAAMKLPKANLIKIIKNMVKSIPDAYKDVFKNYSTDLVREMYRNKMLLVGRTYKSKTSADATTDFDAMMQSYSLQPKEYSNNVVKYFSKLWNGLENVGKFTERLAKIGGYRYLKETFPEMATKEAGHLVRTRAGSPDFYRRGEAFRFYNNLFLFSNAGKEGWRSSIEALKEQPAEYMWKMIKYDILPKMAMYVASSGALVYLAKKTGDKDLEQDAEWLEQAFALIPEHDKTNYQCIPFALTEDGKCVYFVMPHDFTGQVSAGLIWKILNKNKEADITSIIDYTAGGLPYESLSPPISIAIDALNFIRGKNPYDPWRGQLMVSEQKWEAGGLIRGQEFAKQMWNRYGGSYFYRFPYDNLDKAQSDIEKGLNIPGLSGLTRRFVRVSDRGLYEKLQQSAKEAKQQTAKRSINVQNEIINFLNEKKMPTDKDIENLYQRLLDQGLVKDTFNQFYNNQYLKYVGKKKNLRLFNALRAARSNEEREAILEKFYGVDIAPEDVSIKFKEIKEAVNF